MRLCCTLYSKACAVRRMVYEADRQEFKKTASRRVNLQAAVRDKTFDLQMQWLGKDPCLKFTAVGRIAYAVGSAAEQLEAVLEKLSMAQEELELDNFDAAVEDWKHEGAMQNAYASPTTEYKITAVCSQGEGFVRKMAQEDW